MNSLRRKVEASDNAVPDFIGSGATIGNWVVTLILNVNDKPRSLGIPYGSGLEYPRPLLEFIEKVGKSRTDFRFVEARNRNASLYGRHGAAV
ncbi:MAG: hypothetical protein K8R36_02725 [Planctomycetales bacterium]|nr:hypothetical protein [Planctomycetales bacterium]